MFRTVLIFKNNSTRRMYLFISACDIILKDLLGVVGGGPTLSKPIVWKNHLDLAAKRRATSLKNLESTGRHTREMLRLRHIIQIENSGMIKTREMCATQQRAKNAYDKREIKRTQNL